MNLLIVEHDERIAQFLASGFRAEGYGATVIDNGAEGLSAARSETFNAIILDTLAPGRRCVEVCRELRLCGVHTPVLMLSALCSVDDKVEGLRAGADDYVVRPFAFEELLARIEALIRRSRDFRGQPACLTVRDLTLDRDRKIVTRNGRRIQLTAKEMAILDLLMSDPNRVFSRTKILNTVWSYNADPLTNVVDVYVGRIRKKIGDIEDRTFISTVRGYGYTLVSD
jgi:DNA-binding response OmpR family regulator